MKGKSKFTKSEINQIRKLMNEKRKATNKEQKIIRSKIREIGFYWPDFFSYSVQNFNDLIEAGKIKIIEK